MADRGPDSAGLAVFTDPVERATRKFSIYSPDRGYDWKKLASEFQGQSKAATKVDSVENHATLTSAAMPDSLKAWLVQYDPKLHLLSVGRSIDVYKDTGHPCDIAKRYHFEKLNASHCVGHKRMASESDGTRAHYHPFVARGDCCLIQKDSLSNPYSLRRRLEKHGIGFETDNDTEAACRFLEWRMRQGDTLEQSIVEAFKELDGFYTLLMATADKMLIVRDAFACKPAVAAEHDDYIAISSEFRSLAHLPDIQNARIFEPHPEEIYSWKV